MFQDLDQTVAALLLKMGGEKFIREDAEKALFTMLENVTTQRAMNALILGGARWVLWVVQDGYCG